MKSRNEINNKLPMELLEGKGCLKEMTRWKPQREMKSRNKIKNKGAQLC